MVWRNLFALSVIFIQLCKTHWRLPDMKKVWIVILISILFASCEKSGDPIVQQNPNGLLARVLISGKPYQEFSYTNSGLIYEEKSWGRYSKYSYNDLDQLVKGEHYCDPALYSSSTYVIAEAQKRKEWANPKKVPRSTTNTFSYSTDGKFAEANFNGANGNQSSTKYELNEKGQVSKDVFYNEGKPSGYTDYSYDKSGNLIREKHYFISADGKTRLSNETEYEFDTKKNPYFPFNKLIFPGRNTNRNNITKETYTLYGEIPLGIERVQIKIHTYEYNDLGYPVKVDGETSYEYY